jgi:RHS repeat-associated protein
MLNASYVYTADDERIAVYTPTNGTWRWTLREASGKVLRELTSRNPASGTLGTASWSWTKDYIWRDGLLLATRQLEPGATTPATYHYHLDHLGTPRQITDDTNQIVGSHSYHAFGPELSDGQKNEPSATSLKYTGHERDGDLDYMHARYYDPDMGRFLSVDPSTKFDLHNPQSWNRYAYAHNNPINKFDPDGRDALAVTFVGYRVQTPFGRRPLGHSGITIVRGSGRTSYYEFGRYAPGGEVRQRTVPDLVMKNGLPTRESLKAHMAALSAKGQGLPVSGAYFTNDTAAKMEAFAEAREQDASKQGTYGLTTNNCATFCEDVLEAGGEKLDEALNNSPSNVMQELQDRSDFDVHYDPKKDELTVTCKEGSACPP